MADKFALVRSLHHERGEHSGGTHRFLTGYSSRGGQPERRRVSRDRLDRRQAAGAARPRDVPLFVGQHQVLRRRAGLPRPGLRAVHAQPQPALLHRQQRLRPDPALPDRSGADEPAICRRRRADAAAAGTSCCRRSTRLPRQLDRPATLAAFDDFQRRAVEMLASRRTREAFDLSRETARTRDRYGDTHWGKSLLTCRRLVEAGVRFVQCQADYPPAAGDRPHQQLGRPLGQLAHLQGLRREAAVVRPGGLGPDRGPVRSAAWTGTCCSSSAASSAARRRSPTRTPAAGPAATTGRGR